jgi:hypothetical protein
VDARGQLFLFATFRPFASSVPNSGGWQLEEITLPKLLPTNELQLISVFQEGRRAARGVSNLTGKGEAGPPIWQVA